MTDREVMQMALDALETLNAGDSYKTHNAAKALRDRLAQPEPSASVEPVANEQAVIDQFLSNSFPALVAITAPVHAIDIPQERVDETAKRKHEPVAWLSKCYSDDNEDLSYNLWDIDVGEGCFPVYTAPPKRSEQGGRNDRP